MSLVTICFAIPPFLYIGLIGVTIVHAGIPRRISGYLFPLWPHCPALDPSWLGIEKVASLVRTMMWTELDRLTRTVRSGSRVSRSRGASRPTALARCGAAGRNGVSRQRPQG